MASILLLDFDGVLHPDPPNAQSPLWSRSELLQQWLDGHADIDVVVSSTWRNTRTFAQLQSLLPQALASRTIGVTPKIQEEGYTRQLECESWMRQHRKPWDHWIALDDRSWNFRPFEKRLVLTDPKTGLVAGDIERLDEALRFINHQSK
ncbi:MAG: HAD domain-containing protein [Rhodoferax sp.]